MNNLESFMWGVALAWAITSTLVIVDTARSFERVVGESTYTNRTIHYCDKPLYERIEDGCNVLEDSQ